MKVLFYIFMMNLQKKTWLQAINLLTN